MGEKKKRLQELEKKAQEPDFWENNKRARGVNKKISALREEISSFGEIKKSLEEAGSFLEIAEEGGSLEEELKEKINVLEERIGDLSLKTYLDGKHDGKDAVLQIIAGAGGREAEDWTAMLREMYVKYAEKKNWGLKILEESLGERGGPDGRRGIKSVTMEISGDYAFGYLKKEAGVHRLVRISPFSPQSLRHTSFCQVVVFPKLDDLKDVDIKVDEDDLKIDSYRAGGPGGQYTNKTETAVRVTHLPTGTKVSCQAERSQAKNKERALSMLYAKLYQKERKKREENIQEIKGSVDPAWGRQIRSYVMQPYQMVKDLRTEVESGDPESVLDGDLDDFIKAEVRYKEEDA